MRTPVCPARPRELGSRFSPRWPHRPPPCPSLCCLLGSPSSGTSWGHKWGGTTPWALSAPPRAEKMEPSGGGAGGGDSAGRETLDTQNRERGTSQTLPGPRWTMTATRQRDEVAGDPRKGQADERGARGRGRSRPATAHRPPLPRERRLGAWRSGDRRLQTAAGAPGAGPPGAWSRGGRVPPFFLYRFSIKVLFTESGFFRTPPHAT